MKGIEKSLIAEINKLHGDILNSFGTSLRKAIKIGELLTKQKGNLKHGEFITWVNDNLPFTDRTARNYMRVYVERDRIKTETVSDLSLAYQLLIEDKSESKETVNVFSCASCDKLVRMEDADECPPLYECSNDSCGTTFVGMDGRNCPECNRPFSRKLADHACEDCEEEMEESIAFECGNDNCSQDGLHDTEEAAKKCKVEKTRTTLESPTDEVKEEVMPGEASEEVKDNQDPDIELIVYRLEDIVKIFKKLQRKSSLLLLELEEKKINRISGLSPFIMKFEIMESMKDLKNLWDYIGLGQKKGKEDL